MIMSIEENHKKKKPMADIHSITPCARFTITNRQQEKLKDRYLHCNRQQNFILQDEFFIYQVASNFFEAKKISISKKIHDLPTTI